jgi:hypothetical protein
MWYMASRVKHIDVTAESSADPATVYALLRAGETWPTWSPLTSFELKEPAADEPGSPGSGSGEGLGAIRIFRTKQAIGTTVSVERIVELVPDKRFSYALVSGLPLEDYRADIDLTPTATGTSIRWHSTFRPRVPGTGWFYRAVLQTFIARCVRGLAQHAAGVRT